MLFNNAFVAEKKIIEEVKTHTYALTPATAPELTWEQGGLSHATAGGETDNSARIRTTDYIKLAKGSILSTDFKTYIFSVYHFRENDSKEYEYIGNIQMKEDYEAPTDICVRIVFYKVSGANITPDTGNKLDISKAMGLAVNKLKM